MMPYATTHELQACETTRLQELAFRRPVVLLILACFVCCYFSGCFLGQESPPEQSEISNQNEESIQKFQTCSDTPDSRKVLAVRPSLPIAVSKVTPDEAEKLNEIALDNLTKRIERTEPFYRLYSNNKLQTLCFEGTVRAISTIPNPEENDYDNCLYALFIEIDSLFSEAKEDAQIACEVIVNVPIMKDKRILQDNRFLIGDKIHCTCVEYDVMPQSIQEIQLSDDIQSYEHQQYYPLKIKKISEFQPGGNSFFAKREITILPIQMLPKDEKSTALRKERIQSEIARIEEEITKHGGSFSAWKEDYKPIAAKYKKLCDEGYKGWINDSYFSAGGAESSYNTKEYIEGILPYKNYLEQNDIDLIVVRIPSRWDFAARVLASDDFQENPAWVEHYYECLKNDIEIIDPMHEMWNHRFDFPLFYFYHRPMEGHPFEGTSFISAKTIADVLKRYDYLKTDMPITIENSVFETKDENYLWPGGNEKVNPEENISFRQTLQNGKTIGDLVVNTGSPFLFLSNSFFMYPKRSLGASVPGYAAFFLQHIPDWFYQNGIGNPMIRSLIGKREVLSKRKVIIMGGHPAFWKGDFPTLPKYIQDNATNILLENTLDLIDDKLLTSATDGCSFTREESGVIRISQEKGKQFELKIPIPPIEGKTTCMIRLNYEKSSHLIYEVFLNNGTLIDSFTTAIGSNTCAELFVPVSKKQINILIRCSPRAENITTTRLRNIELWYY